MKTAFLKRWPLLVLGVAVLITTSYALIDGDSDGMSDVWEQQHGFATSGSQPADQLPTADPDNDGWTNLEESQAGTDPNSGTPPAGVIRPAVGQHPDFPTAFAVIWPSKIGKQYTLFASPDLSSGGWVQIDDPIMGTGQTIEYGLEPLNEDGTQPERLFWKVVIADVDKDGDTLSDYEEVALGYNPGSNDTDGDGLPDNTDPLPLVSLAWLDRDGANLSEALNTGLLGRWDFEAGGPEGVALESTPATGANAAGPIDIASTNAGWDGRDDWPRAATGMPWACLHLTQPNAHAKIPTARLNADTQTWAMWLKFTAPAVAGAPGVLDSSAGRRTLFAMGASATAPYPVLQCYLDGKGTAANPADNELVMSTWTNTGGETVLYSWSVPAGLDDGQWHHVAIHFNDSASGGGRYQAWFDGAAFDPAKPGLMIGGAFTFSLPAAQSPWCLLGRFRVLPTTGHEVLGARIDRLRVYNKLLTNTNVGDLYNQDIDGDGLYDRVEAQTRFWRDHNHDGIDQQSETTFPSSPFSIDPVGSDHDGDGISSHEEQTLGTNLWKADSDGDLIPDGWERDHGLNPKNANDGSLNPDSDGASNLNEYRYNTNPSDSDTDNDGKSDGNEINGPDGDPETDDGSDPTDGGDGGNRRPTDQLVSFMLGVGDRSGSHSEDYVMDVFRIDPVSGVETRIFTLRSGGFGQYKEITKSFRKGETYTFQLSWQGSNNNMDTGGPGEGPDYDYTFKVEPQGNHNGVVVDSWDPESKKVDTNKKILAENANDVAQDEEDFREKIQNRRVVFTSLDFDVVHPATGVLSEEAEDQGTTGIVAILDSPTTPVTKLRLQENAWLKQVVSHTKEMTPQFSLEYNTPNILQVVNATSQVVEPQMRFLSSGEPFDMILKGLGINNLSSLPETVDLKLHIGDQAAVVDRVYLTVVKAEYDIVLQIYIPYDWVKVAWHPDFRAIIAKGDDRDADPFSGSWRLKQWSRLIPYPELSSTGFTPGIPEGGANAAGTTVHFDRATSLPFDVGFSDEHQGLMPANRLFAEAKAEAEIEANKGAPYKNDWGVAEVDEMKIELKSGGTNPVYRYRGNSKEPLIWPQTITPGITWDIDLKFDTSVPNEPKCEVVGIHDGFPAYEMYAFSDIGTEYTAASRTELINWKPPLESSVTELGAMDLEFNYSPKKLK